MGKDSLFFLRVKEPEEEIYRGILHGHTLCRADGVVIAISHRTVALYLPDIRIIPVAHRPVALDLAQIGVVAVPDVAIALYLSQVVAVGVSDVAVAADTGDDRVVAVPHRTVLVNPGHSRMVRVPYGLGKSGNAYRQRQQYESVFSGKTVVLTGTLSALGRNSQSRSG